MDFCQLSNTDYEFKQTISGFNAIHSFINEKDTVFPVPESPINIVILFVNSKSKTNEVCSVENVPLQ